MNLKAPKTLQIRPMSERTKKALFSSLGEAVVGARVLDLFAGSGSLGLEALSRGATHVTFVDMGAESISLVKENLALAGRGMEVEGHYAIVRAEIFGWLKRQAGMMEPFNLIFADPPYPKGEPVSISWNLLHEPALPPMLRDEGWFILGHSKRDPIEAGPSWEQARRLAHGDSIASFFRKRTT